MSRIGNRWPFPEDRQLSDFVTAILAQLNGNIDTDNVNTESVEKGLKKNWVAVPDRASSPGGPGDIAYASGYLYVCVAEDTWKRVAISTW